jgi:hypothetical protein
VEKRPIRDRSGAGGDYEYASGDFLTWTDRQGEKQYASIPVPDDTPLYQMVGGETVTIRYDPARPDRFYYRELLCTKVHRAVKVTLTVLLLLGISAVAFFLRSRSYSGQDR